MPAFVSKGHFFQVSDVVNASVPTIWDSKGLLIEPDELYDNTQFGIEPKSGLTVSFRESFQTNLQVFTDHLF